MRVPALHPCDFHEVDSVEDARAMARGERIHSRDLWLALGCDDWGTYWFMHSQKGLVNDFGHPPRSLDVFIGADALRLETARKIYA